MVVAACRVGPRCIRSAAAVALVRLSFYPTSYFIAAQSSHDSMQLVGHSHTRRASFADDDRERGAN